MDVALPAKKIKDVAIRKKKKHGCCHLLPRQHAFVLSTLLVFLLARRHQASPTHPPSLSLLFNRPRINRRPHRSFIALSGVRYDADMPQRSHLLSIGRSPYHSSSSPPYWCCRLVVGRQPPSTFLFLLARLASHNKASSRMFVQKIIHFFA